MSGTSTIEVSSTTSRSQSSGLASLRPNPPWPGGLPAADGWSWRRVRWLRTAVWPPGRSGRTEQAFHLLGPKNQQDGVDERGLAHARPAGDDEQHGCSGPAGAPRVGWARVPCPSCAGTTRGPSRNPSPGKPAATGKARGSVRRSFPPPVSSAGRKTSSWPLIVSYQHVGRPGPDPGRPAMIGSFDQQEFARLFRSISTGSAQCPSPVGLQQHVVRDPRRHGGPNHAGCRLSGRFGRRS